MDTDYYFHLARVLELLRSSDPDEEDYQYHFEVYLRSCLCEGSARKEKIFGDQLARREWLLKELPKDNSLRKMTRSMKWYDTHMSKDFFDESKDSPDWQDEEMVESRAIQISNNLMRKSLYQFCMDDEDGVPRAKDFNGAYNIPAKLPALNELHKACRDAMLVVLKPLVRDAIQEELPSVDADAAGKDWGALDLVCPALLSPCAQLPASWAL